MIEELYTVHRQELERYCRTMCSNPEMAEDIVQEVYIRAMSNLDTLAGLDRSQRRAWLYKTARNLYVDAVRKSAARQAREEKCLPPEEARDPFAEMEAAQLILMLPQQDRALFSMRYMEGYSAAQLAKLMDVPQSTIRARLMRARNYLKMKLLEE